MNKSYFIIGWRNLLRNPAYSTINISGLGIGLAVAMLIGLWVFDELSYNRSFANYSRIGKIYHNLLFDDNIYTHEGVPHPIGSELKNSFAEFDDVVVATDETEHSLSYEEIKLSKTGLFIEPKFLEVFSVRMLFGISASLKDLWVMDK